MVNQRQQQIFGRQNRTDRGFAQNAGREATTARRRPASARDGEGSRHRSQGLVRAGDDHHARHGSCAGTANLWPESGTTATTETPSAGHGFARKSSTPFFASPERIRRGATIAFREPLRTPATTGIPSSPRDFTTAGITPSPNATWMKQGCRNLTDCEDGCLKDASHLIVDRDTSFIAMRDFIDTEVVLLPPKSPFCGERFALSLKQTPIYSPVVQSSQPRSAEIVTRFALLTTDCRTAFLSVDFLTLRGQVSHSGTTDARDILLFVRWDYHRCSAWMKVLAAGPELLSEPWGCVRHPGGR